MRQINRVAVLGAGVMGATIAAHLANAGLDVLLLDMVPKELSNEEEAGDMPEEWLKTGRNQPCPCGSGKKFKHCHGKYV